jgi:ABC-type branched-subunit amino acid transport system permease subunit
MGSFFGAAFIVILPIFLNQFLPARRAVVGVAISTAAIAHTELMIFGALIVFFLIVEPHGLARLWSDRPRRSCGCGPSPIDCVDVRSQRMTEPP